MDEDRLSAWYFDEGRNRKYYTNNYDFIDNYINLSHLDVVDIFSCNSNF